MDRAGWSVGEQRGSYCSGFGKMLAEETET
jgi:hypothetical protein